MAQTINRLTARKVETIKTPGYLKDGGGLFLQVGESGSKSWIFEFRFAGRRRAAGLVGAGGAEDDKLQAPCDRALLLAKRRHEPRHFVNRQRDVVFDPPRSRGVCKQMIEVALPGRRIFAGAVAMHLAPIKHFLNSAAQVHCGGCRPGRRFERADNVSARDVAHQEPAELGRGILRQGLLPGFEMLGGRSARCAVKYWSIASLKLIVP